MARAIVASQRRRSASLWGCPAIIFSTSTT